MKSSEQKIIEHPFFSFINPYLTHIDNGNIYKTPIRIIYLLISFFNLIIPFILIYFLYKYGYYHHPVKYLFAYTTIWIIITIASWLSFQLWLLRSIQIKYIIKENDDFVVSPIISHFVQTLGEWIGTWVGVVMFLILNISIITIGINNLSLLNEFYWIWRYGYYSICITPLVGFLIIISTRAIAEWIKAITSIANNTKNAININNNGNTNSENNLKNKNCEKCEHPISKDDRFCENCGNPLNQ